MDKLKDYFYYKDHPIERKQKSIEMVERIKSVRNTSPCPYVNYDQAIKWIAMQLGVDDEV